MKVNKSMQDIKRRFGISDILNHLQRSVGDCGVKFKQLDDVRIDPFVCFSNIFWLNFVLLHN